MPRVVGTCWTVRTFHWRRWFSSFWRSIEMNWQMVQPLLLYNAWQWTKNLNEKCKIFAIIQFERFKWSTFYRVSELVLFCYKMKLHILMYTNWSNKKRNKNSALNLLTKRRIYLGEEVKKCCDALFVGCEINIHYRLKHIWKSIGCV